mmetsp:Transcript_109054/g.303269  ORF Transcript_109054/g.303269 Transcript_109054/m.303269 type:complete len:195 (+) Transcript_109054:127-711(+)
MRRHIMFSAMSSFAFAAHAVQCGSLVSDHILEPSSAEVVWDCVGHGQACHDDAQVCRTALELAAAACPQGLGVVVRRLANDADSKGIVGRAAKSATYWERLKCMTTVAQQHLDRACLGGHGAAEASPKTATEVAGTVAAAFALAALVIVAVWFFVRRCRRRRYDWFDTALANQSAELRARAKCDVAAHVRGAAR